MNHTLTANLEHGSAIQTGSNAEVQAPFWFLAIATVLIASAFIVPLNVAWSHSTFDDYVDADATEVNSNEGTASRQILMATLGLFGLISVVLPGGRKLHLSGTTGVLCLSYFLWCLLTCLWAEAPDISLKRWIVFACEVLAGLGIARRASPRQFVWVTWACTFSWVALGVVAEVTQSTFRPWEGGYRFAGIFHPNEMGGVCALLSMSSLYLAHGRGVRNRLMLGMLGVGVVFMILTGSRTALASMLVSYAAMWLLMTPGPKFVMRSLVAVAGISLFMVASGLGVLDVSQESVELGRQDNDVGSLTGRVPLWEELLGYVAERPLLGYGFNGFWTGDRIADISAVQGWTLSSAHNVYIDLLLNIGLIGAVVCLTSMVLVLRLAARLEARHASEGYGFFGMLIVFALAGGLLETTVGLTWYLSIFGICGTGILATYDEASEETSTYIEPSPDDLRFRFRRFARNGGLTR